MLDAIATGIADRPAMTPAEAQRIFQRVLASWVLDCARLRRLGLDRPSMGRRVGERRRDLAGPPAHAAPHGG